MPPDDTRSGPETQLFASWLQRRAEGRAEPFEVLIAANPQHAAALLRFHSENLRLFPPHAGPGAPGEARRSPAGGAGSILGRVLGDFRVLRELGRGGMGIVYEAEQLSLRRSVALKILPAQLSLNERALARFQREAEITGRLHHRGIVEIYQVGEQDSVHFIAMELIEGTSLDHLIERMRGESFQDVRKRKIAEVVSLHGLRDEAASASAAPDTENRRRSGTKKPSSSASNKNYIESSVKLICQVADALQHAHDAGVIHRDVKPSNILVRRDGVAVLTDFGLAREEGLPSVSITGDFAGTPNYVSPEQAMAGRVPVDHRSDIFSLGATLYELVTLELAFPGHNPHEVFGRILQKPPVHPQKHNPILAADLVTIIFKALDKDPDLRYSSAAELAEDLRAFIEYRPIRAKRQPTLLRAWRWARRQPLHAALGLVLGIGLPLLGWLAWLNRSQGELLARTEVELAPYKLTEKIEQGFLFLGIGDALTAERLFSESLAEDPASREALTGRGLALLGLGRVDEALAVTGSGPASALVPGRLRADILLAAGRDQEARTIEASLTKKPQQAFDKYLEALRLLRPAPFALREMELAPMLWSTPRGAARAPVTVDPRVQYREAASNAIRLLEDALVVDPSAPLYFALSWAAWVARDAGTARRYAAAIEEKWSDQAVAWYYIGLAREVFDEPAALDALARALELDPQFLIACDRRAVLLMRRGEAQVAVTELTRALELAPSSTATRVRLASALRRVGRAQESVAMIRDVLATAPELLEGREILFRGLLDLGRLEEARDEIRRALETEPSSIRWNDMGLLEFRIAADAAAERGAKLAVEDVEPAERALERAMELDPKNPYPLFNLGVVFQETERFERALEVHESALELVDPQRYPDFSVALVRASLGTCYERLGRGQDATQAYEQAIELEPGEPLFYISLALIHGRAGRFHDMDEALQRGIRSSLDPDAFLEYCAHQRVLVDLIAAYVLALDEAGRTSDAMDVLRRCHLAPAKCREFAGVFGAEPSQELLQRLETEPSAADPGG